MKQSPFRTLIATLTGLSIGLAPLTSEACTSFLLTASDGHVYGRTMEFGVPLRSALLVVPRNFQLQGVGVDGKPGSGLNWSGKYAAVGANAFGMPVLVDGMNEAGLVGGLLNAPNTAVYQNTPASESANSIASYQMLTYALTNFATVDEVKAGFRKIQVNSSILQVYKGQVQVRVTLHDRQGKSIVVEYLQGQLVITDNPVGVMTNDPAFSWHLANIGNYANLGGLDKKPLTVKGQVFPPASSGNGLHGIPGSMLSSDRFVRASLYVLNTPTDAPTEVQRSRAWHILNNFDIPYGSIYLDASSGYGGGANAYEFTEWTVVADLKNKTYSIRSFENPSVLTLDFKGFDLNGKAVTNKPLLK